MNFSRKIRLPTTVYFLAISFCLGGYAAQAPDVTRNKASCLALVTSDQTYLESTERVMQLPSVVAWTNYLRVKQKRPALGKNVDKTVFRNGRCFWSISLYESDESKLQLWREYLVEINGKKTYVINPSSIN